MLEVTGLVDLKSLKYRITRPGFQQSTQQENIYVLSSNILPQEWEKNM